MSKLKDAFSKARILICMLSGTFETWRSSVLAEDLDALYCCDGRECGCGGVTNRELWGFRNE